MLLALIAALVLVAAGCISASPTGQELMGTAPRLPPDPEFLATTVAADNAFSVDLFHAAAANRGNFVYSSYVLMTNLAMARAGAAAETHNQFDQVLHAALTPDLDEGLNTVALGLADRSGEQRSDSRKGRVDLTLATALWGQRGTHIKEDLLNRLSASYGTGFRLTDFHSDPEGAREAINRWSSDATHGLSQELVPRGGVTAYTRFLATTAAYIQAPWLVPFDPAKTHTEPFIRSGEPPVDVRMMELTSSSGLRSAEGQGWQALELPYLGDELALDVIMPDMGLFESFEQALTPDKVKEIIGLLQPDAVDVRFPQFQFTTSTNLQDTLSGMGLALPFTRDADFSGVTTDEVLSLSDVVYQGFYGVDEEGTDAPKTATAQSADPQPVPKISPIVINQPFVFAVRDRTTGLILWIGRVVNPV